MIYKIELELHGAWTDITSIVKKDSVGFSQTLYDAKGKATINTLSFEILKVHSLLVGTEPIFVYLIQSNSDIPIRVHAENARAFTGIVRPTSEFVSSGTPETDSVQIQAVDLLYTLQTAAKNSFIAARGKGETLYLSQVMSRLQASSQFPAVTFTVTKDIYVQFFSLNKDENIFSALNEFLWQHARVMRCTADGTINVEPLLHTNSTVDKTITDSDIVGAFSIKKKEQKYSSVVVHYSDYVATDTRKKLVDNIKRDNKDAFVRLSYGGHERNKIKPIFIDVWDTELAVQVFRSIGLNGKEDTGIHGRVTVKGIGSKKESPYWNTGKNVYWNGWRRKLQITYGVYVEVQEYTNSHVIAKGYTTVEYTDPSDMSGGTHDPVFHFFARFKAIYPGAKQTSDKLGNGSGERELTIKAKYIITDENAQNLMNLAQQLYVQNNTEATFTTQRDLTLGAHVAIVSNNAGTDFKAIVKKKKLKKSIGATRIYTYTCVAVSAVSLAQDVEGEVIHDLVSEEIQQNYIGYEELFKALATDPKQGTGDISLIANVNNRAVDLRVVHAHEGYTYHFQLSDDAKAWRGLNRGDAGGL